MHQNSRSSLLPETMLSDDHPLIRACNNRYGIDLEQLSDGTFALRSANMTSMPEYFDTKTRRGNRPPNYFMDKERTRLCIALSPQNVQDIHQLSSKTDALKAIQQAFGSEKSALELPIRVQSHHVLWGSPVALSRDKMEFLTNTDGVPEVQRDPDPTSPPRATPAAKRPRGNFQRVMYNGVAYDDDDEARHAFFMDCLDIKYRTQPTNIQHPLLMNETNTTGIYRTDFYVPSLNAYLETTCSEPSARKYFTCELLARAAFYEGRSVFLVYGGMHAPRRDSYASTDSARTMKIVKFIVEVHTFATGREELVVVADDGYAWMYKNGAYVIDRLGSVMNRVWDHEPIRSALSMARLKEF